MALKLDPINWKIVENPLNWIIIFLMLSFFILAAEIGTEFLHKYGKNIISTTSVEKSS